MILTGKILYCVRSNKQTKHIFSIDEEKGRMPRTIVGRSKNRFLVPTVAVLKYLSFMNLPTPFYFNNQTKKTTNETNPKNQVLLSSSSSSSLSTSTSTLTPTPFSSVQYVPKNKRVFYISIAGVDRRMFPIADSIHQAASMIEGLRTSSLIHMPTKIRRWTINSSPFADKRGQEALEMRNHRKLIVVESEDGNIAKRFVDYVCDTLEPAAAVKVTEFAYFPMDAFWTLPKNNNKQQNTNNNNNKKQTSSPPNINQQPISK